MGLQSRIANYYTFAALLMLLMPLLLYFVAGEWRESISDYAYSSASNILVVFLSISATLFISSAVTDYKWYNAILGLCLLGVALTPHKDFTFLHYFFAGGFFAESIFVMIFFSSKKQLIYKVGVAVALVILLVSNIFAKSLTTLQIEWIGLVPISLHFIGEAQKIID